MIQSKPMKHTESRKWDPFQGKKMIKKYQQVTQMLKLSDKDYKTVFTIFLTEMKEHILIRKNRRVKKRFGECEKYLNGNFKTEK